MNTKRSSLPKPQLVAALLVFIVVLFLGFLYQDTLRETVLVFILYVFWVGKIIIQSFDQRFVWILALMTALVLTVKFSNYKFPRANRHPEQRLPDHSPDTGRIHFWKGRIKLSIGAANIRHYYPLELSWLVIKTLAYHKNCHTDEIKESLRSGNLLVPPEVFDVLGMEQSQTTPDQNTGIFHRIRQWFPLTRRRFKAGTSLPNHSLEKVAAYLESLMEEKHGI